MKSRCWEFFFYGFLLGILVGIILSILMKTVLEMALQTYLVEAKKVVKPKQLDEN